MNIDNRPLHHSSPAGSSPIEETTPSVPSKKAESFPIRENLTTPQEVSDAMHSFLLRYTRAHEQGALPREIGNLKRTDVMLIGLLTGSHKRDAVAGALKLSSAEIDQRWDQAHKAIPNLAEVIQSL